MVPETRAILQSDFSMEELDFFIGSLFREDHFHGRVALHLKRTLPWRDVAWISEATFPLYSSVKACFMEEWFFTAINKVKKTSFPSLMIVIIKMGTGF